MKHTTLLVLGLAVSGVAVAANVPYKLGIAGFTYHQQPIEQAFRDGVAQSKYLAWQDAGKFWGEADTGRLLIQDHGDSTVSYCNLKVKEL